MFWYKITYIRSEYLRYSHRLIISISVLKVSTWNRVAQRFYFYKTRIVSRHPCDVAHLVVHS